MCGRFVQIIDIGLFVKRFGVKHPDEISLGEISDVVRPEVSQMTVDLLIN